MSFDLYHVEYEGLSARNQEAIFLKLNLDDKSGRQLHAIGNIQQGMAFEDREQSWPGDEMGFLKATPLGVIDQDDYERFREICKGIEVPKKQFDGPKRLEPKVPLRRCGEWAADAIAALRKEGVLRSS